ncbi:MAG: NAD(P)-dependent oxidoreductase [Acidobacteriota bacterium]|nr:NAD(P)-dependent oxidoreductase [Acidobacteriota bacterium]
MRVAFLGLGIMGRPMAANLVKAGHEVTVWNRTPGKSVDGARLAASPAAAAGAADVVWICVSDTAAVDHVLFGQDGVDSALREGMIVVDSSTISPARTLEMVARLAEKDVAHIDAPVTGSKLGAESGQLIFIAGGDEATLAKVQPLFQAMGKVVKHMGGHSMGQAAKLAMNLQIAMIFEGFAEALALATKLGVAPEKLIDLIQSSMVRSGVIDYKAPFVLRGDYSPNFPLRLMHKDIRLTLDAAREARVKLPGLETVDEIYEIAHEEGHDDLDYAATLMLLSKWAGIEVGTAS